MTDISASPFAKAPAKVSFPEIEEKILGLWESIDAFQQSNKRRIDANAEPFVFYDGPPFATGAPHYGHLLAGTIKDIVPRFWTMRGYQVERRFGWDCHGLPIEALAQDALGLSGTAAIHEAGVDTFNEQCRSMVQTYVSDWRKTVTRAGRWVDFDNDYKTLDPEFMESVWWVFKQLWEQKRVYKSYRIMPYSWKLTTPLSNFEANVYKDVQDPAITISFPVNKGAPDLGAPIAFLAWTTTPWTLPENLALCVGTDIDYVAIQDDAQIWIVAEARAEAVFKKKLDELNIVGRYKGSELENWEYEPLFPYWSDHANSFRVLVDDYVSTADGTGIVHMAPAYGEDDYRVCTAAGIDIVDGLDADANFLPIVSDFAGRNVKEADKDIIRWLKNAGRLVHQGTINHSYPFCDRTDTPLIYRAIEAWYVKVEDLRDQMTENNEAVRWVPEAVGSGRFGNWLKEARDWNISRNRFWGSCIPVWINVDDPADMICVGSIAELEALSGQKVDDLHKHKVDLITIERDGKLYKRTPEVLDCWFESGSMPYAQQHFPFACDNPEAALEKFFPAHFIAEGLDQTRGWFYTLMVLGTALYGKSPFKNVVVNGMILAEDGKKMSKRLKNYPDPNVVLNEYGADALRAYLIDSPVVRGLELRFSEKGLKEIIRTVVLPYWNALSFFTTYASVDGFDPRSWEKTAIADRPDADRWVISTLQSLIRDVVDEMEAYRLDRVIPRLVSFIDDLTNWYIRSNRRRFWKSDDRHDQGNAFQTLYEVLTTFAQVLAPFMPFLTEEVYQRLVVPVDTNAPASIHWCDYPTVTADYIDDELEQNIAVTRTVVSLGRKLREDARIKVRQPLANITVVCREAAVRAGAEAGTAIINDELNIKQLATNTDEHDVVNVTVKPDFKALRGRCGPKLGAIGKTLKNWGWSEVEQLEGGASITVEDEAISLSDVILERSAKDGVVVATDGRITVILDTTLSPALRREGMAREVTSILQNARKEAQLDVSDRIHVRWSSDDAELNAAINEHAQHIADEILATDFKDSDSLSNDAASAKIDSATINWELVKA